MNANSSIEIPLDGPANFLDASNNSSLREGVTTPYPSIEEDATKTHVSDLSSRFHDGKLRLIINEKELHAKMTKR